MNWATRCASVSHPLPLIVRVEQHGERIAAVAVDNKKCVTRFCMPLWRTEQHVDACGNARVPKVVNEVSAVVVSVLAEPALT